MKLTTKLTATVLLAVLTGAAQSLAGQKTTSSTELARLQILAAKQAWASAHDPGMSAQDQRNLHALAAVKQRTEEHEIAEYQKFKMQQQLALAEASAPRIVFMGGGENGSGSDFQRASMSSLLSSASHHKSHSNSSGYMKVAYVPNENLGRGERRQIIPGSGSDRSFLMRESATTSVKQYPDRFYKRQSIEAATDEMIRDSASRNAEADNHEMIQTMRQSIAQQSSPDSGLGYEPFGVPVPGKSGYVTSPPSSMPGYIDVRGYTPGTRVQDPYSGRIIRVP